MPTKYRHTPLKRFVARGLKRAIVERCATAPWFAALKPGDRVRWKAATMDGVWTVTGSRMTRDRAGAGHEVDIVFTATGLEAIITRKAAEAWERIE